MGVSSKVTINGQAFKKGLRLGGKNIVEDLITGQLTTDMLKGQNKQQWIEAIGGDQVTRLMGFSLAKNVKVAQKQEAMAVAKYFQILVSNTPMDEEYVYNAAEYEDRISPSARAQWKELSKEKRRIFSKIWYLDNYTPKIRNALNANEQAVLEIGQAMSRANQTIELENRISDINKEIEELKKQKEEFFEKRHKPDNDYVRGDWVLTFRGVRFKAFQTSRSTSADVYFSKEDFEVVDDFNSITKIANIIQEKTKDGVVGGGFKVSNDNPRAAMLEYGGYDTGDSGPNIGSKYAHGVKNSHTWQAPKGFYRLTNAMWNDIAKDTKTGRYQSYIRKWINADLSNFSVADVDSAEVKKFLKKKTVRTDEIDLSKLTKGRVK